MPGLIATGTFAFIFSLDGVPVRGGIHPDQCGHLAGRHRRVLRLPGFELGTGVCALAVVATAPVFALALLVQRHFVRGLTLGAIRG